MNQHNLKKEFGRDIVFWGGGIDTQHMLPFGSVSSIKREVKRNIEIFGQNGVRFFDSAITIPFLPSGFLLCSASFRREFSKSFDQRNVIFSSKLEIIVNQGY